MKNRIVTPDDVELIEHDRESANSRRKIFYCLMIFFLLLSVACYIMDRNWINMLCLATVDFALYLQASELVRLFDYIIGVGDSLNAAETIWEDEDVSKKLRYAPRGLKLYCSLFGDVYLNKVNGDRIEVIVEAESDKDNFIIYLDKYGKMIDKNDKPTKGECVIFPSYEFRDWSKFYFRRKEE
jgi:hypothetical protein